MYFSCLLYATCAETNVHLAITDLNRTKIDEHFQVILMRVLQLNMPSEVTSYTSLQVILMRVLQLLYSPRTGSALSLQVILMRVLQPDQRLLLRHREDPSSHPYARVATAKLHKNDPCTDYYVHLNLFECIAGAKKLRLTATFSISGREVAPKFRCEPAASVAFTSGSHRWFPV